MKIAIIGAGAMGSLFGARLASVGESVWLLDTSEPHVRAIREKGLAVVTTKGETIAFPQATTDYADIGTVDLLIIFVKSAATRAAAESAAELLGPNTAVLTLQNGYGNAQVLAEVLGKERVIAGTTAQGATLLEPGRILHGGDGLTHIGEFCGGISPRLQQIAALLSRAGFATTAENEIAPLLWGKLIINAGINALSAITGLENGKLIECGETRTILEMAVSEAAKVAAALEIQLPYDDPVAEVTKVAIATAKNRSSMLQDLDAARITEIDAINGAIVREAARLGLAAPVNQVLVLLIKALERKKVSSVD